VYVVVALGEAVGWATVGLLRPVAGDQLYVYGGCPPEALPSSVVEAPGAMVRSGPAFAESRAALI